MRDANTCPDCGRPLADGAAAARTGRGSLIRCAADHPAATCLDCARARGMKAAPPPESKRRSGWPDPDTWYD